ncbi:LysE family transporter [Herbiconiux sp. CPCC 203407]|uniref:LysE family transporter n=1 Tax=Herbiconiux oxytropis TaxID=2970915 RepID=A0AA42BVL9_9MICO|nr:LysE family transporter [Herbiconiux oxytropis]MCS5721536.1 LysE family transporter [Herbiconiux oxytropis]MCS5724613.1 LysE family transporter [Herbiconiux oxytropis]
MDALVSFVSGSVAGLALAAPLGAIGILLLQEGASRGLRRGLPGAAAVATVDVLYCVAAVVAGSVAGRFVDSWTPWPQLMGGSAVIALGVRGLLAARRPKPPETGRPEGPAQPALRRFPLFLALTALNPATLLYFTAILTGLDRFTQSPSTAAAFVAGVGVASFGWQALLVALGAGLGRKAGPAIARGATVIGHGVVVLLGVILVVRILLGPAP